MLPLIMASHVLPTLTVYETQATYSLADEQTAHQEYASLEAINDNFEKMIVSMDNIIMSSNNGIFNVKAWQLDQML